MEKDARIEVTPFWAKITVKEAIEMGMTLDEINEKMYLYQPNLEIVEYNNTTQQVYLESMLNDIRVGAYESASKVYIRLKVVLYDQVKPITMYQSKIEFKDGE